MDIDVYVDNIVPENKKILKFFQIFIIGDYAENNYEKHYDLTVFQMGNSPYHNKIMDAFMKYGGILELHDISLHHYLAARSIVVGNREEYRDTMIKCHGIKGKEKVEDFFGGKCMQPWADDALEFTVNKVYVDHAQAVIVHSDFARQMVKGIAPEKMVALIPLHTSDIPENPEALKKTCRDSLGIAQRTLVFGAFGLATPFKRIVPTLQALHLFQMISKCDFRYYIVGENRIEGLEAVIEELELSERVIITGRVELEEFKQYMSACDIAFNLRYPTQGESSASLQRLIGYGKVVFVSSVGSFKEYPDEFVRKIRTDAYEVLDILKNICELYERQELRQSLSRMARTYVWENFNIKDNAEKYFEVFREIQNGRINQDYVEELTDNIALFGVDINTVFL